LEPRQDLAAGVSGEPLVPPTLTMRKPDATALGRCFDRVRVWSRDLAEHDRAAKVFGNDIEWTDTNHRQPGRDRMPSRILIPIETAPCGSFSGWDPRAGSGLGPPSYRLVTRPQCSISS
jgi:hypothetical protein